MVYAWLRRVNQQMCPRPARYGQGPECSKHPDRPPGGGPGDAERAPQLGFAWYGIARGKVPCQDAPTDDVSYLNVQMDVACVVQHDRGVIGLPPLVVVDSTN